jgi:hypothetical protein
MITRKQYMNNEYSHEEYYGQFLTPGLIEAVGRRIGVERIKKSTDPHFNDITLTAWDHLRELVQYYTLRRLKEADPCGGSLSDAVCIAKRCASAIREGLDSGGGKSSDC